MHAAAVYVRSGNGNRAEHSSPLADLLAEAERTVRESRESAALYQLSTASVSRPQAAPPRRLYAYD